MTHFNQILSQSAPVFLAPKLIGKAIATYRQISTLQRQNKRLRDENALLENDINFLKKLHQTMTEIEPART